MLVWQPHFFLHTPASSQDHSPEIILPVNSEYASRKPIFDIIHESQELQRCWGGSWTWPAGCGPSIPCPLLALSSPGSLPVPCDSISTCTAKVLLCLILTLTGAFLPTLSFLQTALCQLLLLLQSVKAKSPDRLHAEAPPSLPFLVAPSCLRRQENCAMGSLAGANREWV